jgi:starch-binding outer membrane protein, SusD/RagB family
MKPIIFNKTFCLMISLLIILTTSCEDFLEEHTKSFINPNDFYTTQSDCESGLFGIYEALHLPGLYHQHALMAHVMHSEYTWPWSLEQESGYNIRPDFWLYLLWDNNYELIKRANILIENLEGKTVNFDEDIQMRYLSEAKFLRVLSYMHLVQWYGDVPLITTSFVEDYLVEKNPSSEVWDFIEQQLIEAIPYLPHKSSYSGSDISRANKEAAKMALAKAYMVRQKWSEAKALVDEIIASGEYELEIDIMDNWRTSNEHGIESIFEIDFASGLSPRQGQNASILCGPSNLIHPITGNIVSGGWTGIAVTHVFYNTFDDLDTRKYECFFDTAMHSGPVGRFYCSKYFDPTVMNSFAAWQGPVNFVVYRYADVLLMKAEIENELNIGPNADAYQAIDEVRERSNAPLIDRNLTYDEFLEEVFDERARELFFEGHRFFDLKRRGYEFLKNRVEPARLNLFDYVGYSGNWSIEEHELVLPIPQYEIDANPNLIQNSGY